jgi:hypothetical protein
MGEYTFKLDGLGRIKHSKPEIIESLKRYAEMRGVDTIRTRQYDEWKNRLASTWYISNIFGSWGKALQAAGLRSVKTAKLEFRAMVEAFKACWKEHDAPPSRMQLEAYLEKHRYPFRWSSYRRAYGGHAELARMIVAVQEGRIPESNLFKKRRPTYREPVSLKLRTKVLKRDHHRCVKCGADPKIDKTVKLEVDHVVPASKKGPSVLENLQTLCSRCNSGKSNSDD